MKNHLIHMKIVKYLAGLVMSIFAAQSFAQVTMDFEPANVPSSANCWTTGALVAYYSPSTVINGGLSGRTNATLNNSSSNSWIKTPWLKPGSGNITIKVRLDGGTTISRIMRLRFFPYNANATTTLKEGSASADSITYTFASPVSGTGSSEIRSLTFPIPSSIANSSNVYKVVFSFMGDAGAGRIFMDDISVPGTYWADPSNKCLPLPVKMDADGDGVQDSDDAYPNDAVRAYDNWYPAKSNGTLMFEDLWPSVGDYDFNDLVLGYRFNTVTDAGNKVVEIKYEITPKAIGASFNNGFGFMLDGVDYDKVVSVTGLSTEAKWLGLNKNGTEADLKTACIIVFTSANNVLPSPGGSGVNVDPNAPYVNPETIKFTVSFMNDGPKAEKSTLSYGELTADKFNPFIIINQDREKEVHLPGYAPTAKAEQKFFGTGNDNSSEGNYYKTKDNLPWALNVPMDIPHTSEKNDFIKGYLYFADWARSGGREYTDWYEDSEKFRNNEVLYRIKK